eukprot:TRINITY_DN6437_c0_g1_i1.p1 TRINITY_DN6437_c0_g1~~TRINITY_DN6437_c0_g1_i1.p1  ORF type:complete len:496 (+),score=66.66 TRINITY_DN6437_c0_g1_i1:89-1489(+)
MASNAELLEMVTELQMQAKRTRVDHDESLDTIWMLLAACLVFFMHAGFSLLEAGNVRLKNTQNIMAKNLMVVCTGFISWYAIGWALAYGSSETPNKVVGSGEFFAQGFRKDKTLFRNWFFQGAFCATGATIVSGAIAERTRLKGFSIYTVLMTSIIYPFVVHWGWSGSGFLSYTNDEGESVSFVGPAFMDFAGSGLVHMSGGVGALCGAILVGPRKGRFDPAVDQEEFIGHSVPFCVLGTLALWFGWYGFNPGSTLSMHDANTAYTAGIVAVNTTLAPCAAGLVVFMLRASVLPPKLLDVRGFCNGILAGLVAITAGCAVLEPWESLVVGLIGGIVYASSSIVMQKLNIDDVVDATAVHGACGAWGVLAVGFFGNPDEGLGGNGLMYGGDQMLTQTSAIVIIVLWVGILSTIIFVTLKSFQLLRQDDELQVAGADYREHAPPKAYTLGNLDPASPTCKACAYIIPG